MSTYETIQNNLKESMKKGDTITRDCLRMLISDIKNQTVNAGKELTEDIVLNCIRKNVKQHNDSISQFKEAGREELCKKELLELEILNAYLPQMLTQEQTESLINGMLISDFEPIKKNFGLIMKKLGSNVDKKIASTYLNQVLK